MTPLGTALGNVAAFGGALVLGFWFAWGRRAAWMQLLTGGLGAIVGVTLAMLISDYLVAAYPGYAADSVVGIVLIAAPVVLLGVLGGALAAWVHLLAQRHLKPHVS